MIKSPFQNGSDRHTLLTGRVASLASNPQDSIATVLGLDASHTIGVTGLVRKRARGDVIFRGHESRDQRRRNRFENGKHRNINKINIRGVQSAGHHRAEQRKRRKFEQSKFFLRRATSGATSTTAVRKEESRKNVGSGEGVDDRIGGHTDLIPEGIHDGEEIGGGNDSRSKETARSY